jgi:hypothetical protein
MSWPWWYSPIIPAPGRLRQKDFKFQVSLGYIAKPCLKKKKKKRKGGEGKRKEEKGKGRGKCKKRKEKTCSPFLNSQQNCLRGNLGPHHRPLPEPLLSLQFPPPQAL